MGAAKSASTPSDSPYPRRRAGRRWESAAGYLFVAPQVLGVLAFVLIPFILVGYFSAHEWNVLSGTFDYVALENYQAFFEDPLLVPSLQATLTFSVALVALNVPLSLALAVLLNRKLPGMTFFRTLFISPVVVSLVAWVMVWGFLFQDNGGINAVLRLFNIDGPNWLVNGPTAMFAVVIVQVFKTAGVNMVLYLSALQNVPRDVQDAARIDGASELRVFFKVTLPLISPMVMLTLIITVIGSLQVFAQIAVLTKGGPGVSTMVLVYYLYRQAFQFGHFGYGSVISIFLFLILLVLTITQWQLRRRWVFYED